MNKMAHPRKPPPVPKASPAPKEVKRHIDLNTNFGLTLERSLFEGRNISLLDQVSSVNIPCCVHDGHPVQVYQDIQVAKSHHCSIGGLIGYPDPKNFGNQTLSLEPAELNAWIQVQLGTFRALCQANRIEMGHIRPYGALYKDFVENPQLAVQVAKAIKEVDPWLILVVPLGPAPAAIEAEVGLPVAKELYLGKRLTPEGALDLEVTHDNMHPQSAFDQAKQLVMEGTVTTIDGQTIPADCKTLHIHPSLRGHLIIAERIRSMIVEPVAISLTAASHAGWLQGLDDEHDF